MAFAAATVLTNVERAMVADRMGPQSTYTNTPKYLGIGTGATGAARTAAATDTALSTPILSRVAGTVSTVTTTLTGDTMQVIGSFTMTAASAVDEGGLWDAASAGNMVVSWTQLQDNFNSGDSYAVTVKIQWL
jgi:hypothetical protein